MDNQVNGTHYKSLMNKKYLGSWDIPAGGSIIINMTGVNQEEVVGDAGKKSVCVVGYFSDCKPMILNSTNCSALERVFKTPYVEFWRGPIEVVVDRNVRFGGKMVEGLCIRPYAPRIQSQVLACTDCGQVVEAAAGKTPEQIAAYTVRNYGRCLCASCASAEKARRKEKEVQTEAGVLNDILGTN